MGNYIWNQNLYVNFFFKKPFFELFWINDYFQFFLNEINYSKQWFSIKYFLIKLIKLYRKTFSFIPYMHIHMHIHICLYIFIYYVNIFYIFIFFYINTYVFMWCVAHNALRLQPATLLKVTLLHGCFSRFLNCTNGTKSRNASHMRNLYTYIIYPNLPRNVIVRLSHPWSGDSQG